MVLPGLQLTEEHTKALSRCRAQAHRAPQRADKEPRALEGVERTEDDRHNGKATFGTGFQSGGQMSASNSRKLTIITEWEKEGRIFVLPSFAS